MSNNTRARANKFAVPGDVDKDQPELLHEPQEQEQEKPAPQVKGWRLLDDGWHLIG